MEALRYNNEKNDRRTQGDFYRPNYDREPYGTLAKTHGDQNSGKMSPKIKTEETTVEVLEALNNNCHVQVKAEHAELQAGVKSETKLNGETLFDFATGQPCEQFDNDKIDHDLLCGLVALGIGEAEARRLADREVRFLPLKKRRGDECDFCKVCWKLHGKKCSGFPRKKWQQTARATGWSGILTEMRLRGWTIDAGKEDRTFEQISDQLLGLDMSAAPSVPSSHPSHHKQRRFDGQSRSQAKKKFRAARHQAQAHGNVSIKKEERSDLHDPTAGSAESPDIDPRYGLRTDMKLEEDGRRAVDYQAYSHGQAEKQEAMRQQKETQAKIDEYRLLQTSARLVNLLKENDPSSKASVEQVAHAFRRKPTIALERKIEELENKRLDRTVKQFNDFDLGGDQGT